MLCACVLSYQVPLCLIKWSPFPCKEKAVYKSPVLIPPLFTQSVNISNYLAIIGKTIKCSDMLHAAAWILSDSSSTYRNHTYLIGRMSWMCWDAKLNLQPTSDLFLIFYCQQNQKTTVFCPLAHNYFFIRHPFTHCYNCMDQNIELHAEIYHIARQTFLY